MVDSGAQRNRATDASSGPESQHDTIPRLMVGSWAGEVAVVEARTGRVCWQRRTKRERGMFAMEGEVAVSVSGMPFAVRKRIDSARLAEAIRRQIHIAQETTPAQVEARRASDGALLWTYTHPKVRRRLYFASDAGTVVSASDRHVDADAPTMQAFDAMTGALLWERKGQSGQESIVTLRAARGERIYTSLNDSFERITALDIRSGRPLWERRLSDYWVLSRSGALIGEQRQDYDHPAAAIALMNARDGSDLSSFPTDGVIRHLTDGGIAYIGGNTYEDATWIAAVNARTGEELWRTPDVPHYQLALDGAILCYLRGIPEKGNVEIGALDATTGERLWQWRSPGSLGELLRLWGPGRMPLMLWDSTEKSVATLAAIVGRPWFHLRRPPSRLRVPPRQQTLAARLHDIRQEIASNVGWPLWHEVQWGHWRHPWQLDSAMNANRMAARWGMVFLGTWLGLFALDATSGRLLWHALPTIDLSDVDPALAP
jgi:outer membrane protein assembly factor BamB